MDNIKVYKINDDWVATKWQIGKTLSWYMGFTDTDISEFEIDDIEEVSLDDFMFDGEGNYCTFKESIEAEEDFEEPIVLASIE